MSTSGFSGSSEMVPAIRSGHLRIGVRFSEPLPVDLTMLMYCEFASVLDIGKTNKGFVF